MAYATYADMVARFGETEILRLAAPDGGLDGEVDRRRVDLALADATALIDSYIRRRYLTPLNPVPPEVAFCCCALARHALAQGEGRMPSEQMGTARKDALTWLGSLAAGNAALPATDAVSPAASYARTQDRDGLYQPRTAPGLL